MYLQNVLQTDSDVFLTVGSDGGSEDFVLSPNRWKKLAAEFGLGGITETAEPAAVTPAMYDRICQAAEATRAVREGARILSAGPKSRRELIHKLCDRGCTRCAAEEAADFLVKRGYLNEEVQAENLARALLRRNRYGRLRIRAYLNSHGYSAAAVNKALSEISPAEWLAGLETVLSKKYSPWPAEPEAGKKAYAALLRLGYTAEEVRLARAKNADQ